MTNIKGCHIEQIIVQLSDKEIDHEIKRYTVNAEFWNGLDNYNKMALKLHEIIYREAILNPNGTSSMTVRKFGGQLLKKEYDFPTLLKVSSKFDRMNTYEFYKEFTGYKAENIAIEMIVF